jgi:SAM-dependent methyltransferase
VDKEWQEAYTFAVIGERIAGRWNESGSDLRTNVDYPGPYGFTFERAVSGWWIGLYSESLHLFRQLRKNPTMLPIHIAAVKNNLENLEGTIGQEPLVYHELMYERLRVKFHGAREIKRNYSQMYQDLFVLTMLNGKKNGTFLEIGCGDPWFGNNTKLLEEWGWKGISIDIDPVLTNKFRQSRYPNRIVTADATRIDYSSLIEQDYDYLQIDIEPPLGSLEVLLRIPFDEHRFAVITFEHDDYRSAGIKERSRSYLRSHGYLLVAGDVSVNQYESCEDWWIYPDLVDSEIMCRMRVNSDNTKRADKYMLGSL